VHRAHPDHAPGSSPAQCSRGRAERAAGRHHVVHEPDRDAGQRPGRGERAAQIAPSRRAREAGLARRIAHAPQRARREPEPGRAGHRARELAGRVEAPRAQPARVQRHRHHEVRGRARRAFGGPLRECAQHGARRGVEARDPTARVLEAVHPGVDRWLELGGRDERVEARGRAQP